MKATITIIPIGINHIHIVIKSLYLIQFLIYLNLSIKENENKLEKLKKFKNQLLKGLILLLQKEEVKLSIITENNEVKLSKSILEDLVSVAIEVEPLTKLGYTYVSILREYLSKRHSNLKISNNNIEEVLKSLEKNHRAQRIGNDYYFVDRFEDDLEPVTVYLH